MVAQPSRARIDEIRSAIRADVRTHDMLPSLTSFMRVRGVLVFRRTLAGFYIVTTFLVVALPSIHAQNARKPTQAVKPPAQPLAPIAGPNAEVVALSRAGSKEATIIGFVKNYDGSFNTSARDIVALSKAGVSEAVIDAMIEKGKAAAASTPASPSSNAATEVATVSTPPTASTEIVLQDGVPVRLRLTESLSSDVTKLNDSVKLSVVDDVVVDGRVLIKKDTLVSGKVTQATPQRLARPGRLDVDAGSVRAVDGAEVRLRGRLSMNGGSSLMRGHEAKISSGTYLAATVDGTLKIFGSPEAPPAIAPSTQDISTTSKLNSNNVSVNTAASNVAPPSGNVPEPEMVNVVYRLDASSRRLVPLPRETAKTATRLRAFGFGGAKATAAIDGEQCAFRIRAGQPMEFVVQLATGVDPSKFQLFLFEVKENTRQSLLGEATLFGGANSSIPGLLPINVGKYGQSSYRLTSPSSLGMGEYGFSPSASNEVFCFGVDQ